MAISDKRDEVEAKLQNIPLYKAVGGNETQKKQAFDILLKKKDNNFSQNDYFLARSMVTGLKFDDFWKVVAVNADPKNKIIQYLLKNYNKFAFTILQNDTLEPTRDHKIFNIAFEECGKNLNKCRIFLNLLIDNKFDPTDIANTFDSTDDVDSDDSDDDSDDIGNISFPELKELEPIKNRMLDIRDYNRDIYGKNRLYALVERCDLDKIKAFFKT